MAVVFAVFALLVGSVPAATFAQSAGDGLRIVVIEGEDAVNIIQQRTAVAPIVEVRDKNNLPVAGATVTFAVGNGGSFGGASTLTVVTNSAGQAAAKGLTPTLPGALRIEVTAVYQGQKATAAISQTNYMTVSQAAQAGQGAAASGGGISGKAIAIIGGVAVAGGAGAAIALSGSSSPTTTTTTTTTTNTQTTTTTTAPITPATTTTTTTTTSTTTTTTQPVTCSAPALRSISGAAAGTRVDVGANENFIDLDVVGNCPWTVTTVPSWIQPDPSSGNPPSTRIRLRVERNTSSSGRTAELRFVAGPTSTSLVINQDGAVLPITYSGTAGSSSTTYTGPASGGGGDGPTTGNFTCTYTTTVSNISASITTLGENLTAGEVRFTANETSNGFCATPALGSSDHVYGLAQGTIRNNSLDARFNPSTGNRPQTTLTMTGTRNGTSIGVTITIRRVDSTGSQNWTLNPSFTLTQR